MTDHLTRGLDAAVQELVDGLEVLDRYIREAGLTDEPIVRLRDNLRRTIDAWKADISKT
jgi:hypothetical protein